MPSSKLGKPRIYTEIRISHKTKEAKATYENLLDAYLKVMGYNNRNEWVNEKIRELSQAAIEKDKTDYIDKYRTEHLDSLRKQKVAEISVKVEGEGI
jgi:hypothetical protein